MRLGGDSGPDAGGGGTVYIPPELHDAGVGLPPCVHQGLQLLLGQAVVQRTHGFQRPHRAAVAQGQLGDLALLPEMAVDPMFDHGDMEHLAGRSAVDVTALGEYLLPPLLPSDPGDDPRFDGRKVRHEEAASRLGDKGGADQFGEHQRDRIVEQLHGVKAPVPHQRPGLFQIGQMVLRKVLHLDEPPGKSAGSIGSVELDQPTGAVIRTDH